MNPFKHSATPNLYFHYFWKSIILFLFFNFVDNSTLNAQVPYQRDFTAKSPEASAFNKYGHIGVSYFTGSPNISFPLSLSEDSNSRY